ncbi:uncharacterized protein TNCV_3063261 [Trichonephila clavipes]|nr:uncharacterized protein TNCV_3063261 [Trichonephila clavipes]
MKAQNVPAVTSGPTETVVQSASKRKLISNNSLYENMEGKATRIESSHDIDVALYGSWQKRGYQSLSGILTATSVDTEKVVDFEAFSKHCRCKTTFDSSDHEPSCTASDSATSGGMEVKSIMTIFERSEAHFGVRYTKYLGDGD